MTVVTVITSTHCPHCPTGVEIARKACEDTGAELKELSVSTKEGWEKATSLGIMGVPSILINDKLAFEGAPPVEELVDAIKNASKD